MSTDTPNSDVDGEEPESRSISLTWEPETEMWNAVDVDLGIASVGETREEALENLDEAVALHTGEAGESIETPEEEREVLDELGIDPDEVEAAREDAPDVPEFLQ